MASIVEKYSEQISGVISCFDRIVIQGTLPVQCHPEGMTSYLHAKGIRIFDYPKFAEPFRETIRTNAERVAQEAGIDIEFVRKTKIRKEDIITKVIERRGRHPGLVHILSAMEACDSYTPWHDKKTHKTYLKRDSGKCLHYYFYFIDEDLGLGYLRVPTWCPFRLQFYFNEHALVSSKLSRAGIVNRLHDNAFVQIQNYDQAQQIADTLDIDWLKARLDAYAERYCPVTAAFETQYHWSLMQVEFSTDILFKRQSDLGVIYDRLSRTAIHTVKPDHVATFLGRKLNQRYEDEMGNVFGTRLEGTCIKHYMGDVSIKMYDKYGLVLRIETTVNNVSFFKHLRNVRHRNGEESYQMAPLKKTIYSLFDLRKILTQCNARYLDFISTLDDPSSGEKLLKQVSEPKECNGRNYPGFNFFSAEDQHLFEVICRGEFTIQGFRNSRLKRFLPDLSTGQISRRLKRLRVHGLIKRIGRTYKYYLTELGRRVIITGLSLKEFFIIPSLAKASIQ